MPMKLLVFLNSSSRSLIRGFTGILNIEAFPFRAVKGCLKIDDQVMCILFSWVFSKIWREVNF